MAKFTLLNHSLVRNEIASIHRAGCRDIEREAKKQFSQKYDIEAESAEAVAAEWIDEEMEEMGYSTSDIKIHPCCKEA